jgi:hypothetical protein
VYKNGKIVARRWERRVMAAAGNAVAMTLNLTRRRKMTARIAPMPALLAAAMVVLGPQLLGGVGPVAAQGMHAPERFAQLRRPGDEGGDPTEPGGLPGRSERSEDRPMTSRGIKQHKKATPDKEKATSDKNKSKTEDRTKKDQR